VARLRAYLLAAVAALSVTPALAQSSASPTVSVLSPEDTQRYRQIFQDERTGNFADAQALVAQLTDRSLVGYAQALHYLSAYSGQASAEDLISWLEQYRDLPVADRIYKLAVERSTKVVKRHHKTVEVKLETNIPTPAAPPRHRGGGYEDPDLPDQSLSTEAARNASTQITQAWRAGQPAQGDSTVQALAATGSVSGSDIARLYQKVAAYYMAAGQDYEAFDVALRPAGSDRLSAPMLDWWAGLAAYRMGKFDVAAGRFETLLQNSAIPNWVRGAAAFWAARAYMQNNNPTRVVALLTYTAQQQPTFYGILAQKVLGESATTRFTLPVVDPASLAVLMQDAALHRAVALWQAGQTEFVHDEMTRALANLDLQHGQTYAAIAHQMSFADLELRASEMLAKQGTYLTGLFPVPSYGPADGYRLDQALVLAFTRTESKFQPAALSPAGARGLMQLMPATAAQVAHGQPTQEQLCDPGYNMALGQKYLEELLAMAGGGVLQLAAAYNAGPGNVMKWMNGKDDPLMFIETMSAQETRSYVKRVMTYYWIYSELAGKTSKTLEDTARGYWPQYGGAYGAPATAEPASTAPIHLIPPPGIGGQSQAPASQQPSQPMLVSDASTPH
jgi:soluble lytic murein transglycosylase